MQNQKGNIILIIVGIVAIAILAGGVGYFITQKPVQKEDKKQQVNTYQQQQIQQEQQKSISEITEQKTEQPETKDEMADWLPFKSSYFTLSFKIPPGFEVKEDRNYISIAKSPYYVSDMGDSNSFFKLQRYDQYFTRKERTASYNNLLKNVKESNIFVDGSSFLVVDGDDWGRFEGESAGRVRVVLFDASWLEIIDNPKYNNQDFDAIAIGNKIISTFKFIK